MEKGSKQIQIVYKSLRKNSRISMTILTLVLLGAVGVAFGVDVAALIPEETRLIIKMFLFMLYFGAIPLVFYSIRSKTRALPDKYNRKAGLKRYAWLHGVKLLIYAFLSFIAICGFLLTHDPLILILVVAGIFFIYFETPAQDKITMDLTAEEENEPE